MITHNVTVVVVVENADVSVFSTYFLFLCFLYQFGFKMHAMLADLLICMDIVSY
jgi:hypothetical protein